MFVSYNGDFDIQKTHLNNKGCFVVSSGEQDSGIIGKTDIPARIFPKNTITCDMFGNVFYRNFDYKMVTHARVFCLEFVAGNLNEKIALFIVATMKYLKFKFHYSNMASWRKIQNLTILLPVYPLTQTKNTDSTFLSSCQTESISCYSEGSSCHSEASLCHSEQSEESQSLHCHTEALAEESLNANLSCHTEGKARSIPQNKESKDSNRDISVVSLPQYDKTYEIAFDFMESFIKAIEKESIKDVVLWGEKKLKAYKACVRKA